jgi:hypothetical protein
MVSGNLGTLMPVPRLNGFWLLFFKKEEFFLPVRR